MAAYLIGDVREVLDTAKMNEYRSRVGATVEKHGGRYLAAGGSLRVVEGEWRPVFPLVLEFPSMAQLERWYESEEYRELKALRHEAARMNIVFLDGLAPAPRGAKE